MKIGIDIDGVLIDNDIEWTSFMNKQVSSGQCNHAMVSAGQKQIHWDYWLEHCASCFDKCLSSTPLDTHMPRPDAFDVMNRWFNRGTKFFILTSRDPAIVGERTKDWLSRFGFMNLAEDVVFSNDKARWCNILNLDIHLDDAPHHIYSIAEFSSTLPILYLAPWNEYINDVAENPLSDASASVHVPGAFFDEVANWKEFDDLLENINSRSKQPKLVSQ